LPAPGFKTRTVQSVGKSAYLLRYPGAKLRSILPENQKYRSFWHLSVTALWHWYSSEVCGHWKHEAKLQINVLR